MPQMNPLLWLFLFIIFLIIFLSTNPLIYFSKKFSFNKTMPFTSSKMLNWKW
uniref:ATP synthase F0 subunit 8 n=1 Tax=Hemicaecilius smithersi TaxID=2597000 RepID=A0A8K1ZFN7_9NEOP|nr:ATP synthase F0 subunit 8 [Hemicaecilius smithersi]